MQGIVTLGQKAFERDSRVRPDGIEFALIRLEGSDLMGGHRHSGYGTEAVRLICEDGIFFRGLHNIKVEVNGYNRRAMKLYERLEFRVFATRSCSTATARTGAARLRPAGPWMDRRKPVHTTRKDLRQRISDKLD